MKSLEGRVLNCDRVTTIMAEEIRLIGLNFQDAEKRVHGVEAMVESHKASISQLIHRVHNLDHPAVSSTSTGEVGEAKAPAAEVRHIAANLESTSAQMATLTGRMHPCGTMPKRELAKVEALELQVRLLMTRWNKVSMRYMRSGRRSKPDPMAVHPKERGRILMSLVTYKENWNLWRTNINY